MIASRTQSLNLPLAVLLSCVDESVMQPTFPPLPKLDHVRDDSQPAPEGRHGDLFLPPEPACNFLDSIFQLESTVVVVFVVVVLFVLLLAILIPGLGL